MPPDLLTRVARRTALRQALDGVSAGSLVAGVIAAIAFLAEAGAGVATGVGIASGVSVALIAFRSWSPERGRAAAAAVIERIHPTANTLITYEELQRHPDRAPEWIHRRLAGDVARQFAEVEPASVVRLSVTIARAAVSVIVSAALMLLLAQPRIVHDARMALEQAAVDILPSAFSGSVRLTIDPPAYTGRERVALEDPTSVDVLEGSVLRFETSGGVLVRFGEQPVTGPFVARETGYFAIAGEGVPTPRLIPLTVTPDSAPAVRVETPGKDLLLPAGDRTIPVQFTARDDLALASVRLRYTRVTGSGEQFEFREGDLPVEIERVTQQEWRGRGRLPLPDLRLEPGDSLVYRVVASDRRSTDAGVGVSDTFFVEIMGPGQVPLDGVDMPADMERYALSQQMIVLKLERLRARERSMPAEAVTEEAAAIAAEQRAVRANFIFLMGGHVEDEEVEAEQSHEIQEGRLQNTARRDINVAIGHMTRAEQSMVAARTADALPPARLAVEALQRAFGRSRYLLRSLTVRSRLDMSRRLSGDARQAQSWQREAGNTETEAASDPRQFLGRLLQAGRLLETGREMPAGSWQALAESALRMDPASAFWQQVSRSLLALETAAPSSRRAALEAVIASIAPHAQRLSLPATPLGAPESRAVRAWRLEQRR